MKKLLTVICLCLIASTTIHAEDRLELETTFIKGNKELPQVLYIVPWKKAKSTKKKEQQIVLYSLFGDLFEPVNPDELSHGITNTEIKY